MSITTCLDTVVSNYFIVKTLQYRAALSVSDKVMGHIDAFCVGGNDPQNAGNNKEKFFTYFSFGKKVFTFPKMLSMKIRGNDCCIIARYGSE